MIRKFGVFLAALALIAGFGLTGCDSWMSGDHFFDTIADEVKYANAEVIPVYVRYPDTQWGTSSPNGNSSQKVDIPFTITAVDASRFGFYKWAAFSTSDFRTFTSHSEVAYDNPDNYENYIAEKELGEDVVVFEDRFNPVTTAKVLTNRNDVFIMPVCVERPYVDKDGCTSGENVKNTGITILFSSPMDASYLIETIDGLDYPTFNTDYIAVETYTGAGEYYRYNSIETVDLVTKNGVPVPKSLVTENGVQVSRNFMKAELSTSGKTLTLTLPDSGNSSDPTCFPTNIHGVRVSISREVRNSLGDGYTMAEDASFRFQILNDTDTIKPDVLNLEVGTTNLKANTSATDTEHLPRVASTLNIHTMIADRTKTGEQALETNVAQARYMLYLLDVPGNSVNLSSSVDGTYGPYSVSYVPGGNMTDSPLAVPTEEGGFTFPVTTISGLYDGLYKLVVWGVDKTSNEGSYSSPLQSIQGTVTQGESQFVYFIKDSSAPDADTCKAGVSAESDDYAPYGWYNTANLSNIQIKEASAGAIVDRPNYGNIYGSENVWWTFYVGNGSTAWKNSMTADSTAWSLVSTTPQFLDSLLENPIDPSTLTEGSVSVYALFRDDVGNISSLASLDSVKYDGTAPQVGTLSWITPTDVPVGFTGYAKIGNHTLAIPFTESLSGIKKIAIEVVPPGGGAAYKQAFSDADFNIKVRNSASSVTYDDCNFTRSPATPSAGVPQNLVIGSSSDALDYALKSSTSYTYQNAIYLDNLKIAANDSDLVEGNYTIKVKLYDAALNESAEKTITICVDNAAPVIQKLLVKDAKQYAEEASEPDDNDTYKYFLPSSAYDSSLSGYKATLEVTVQEAAGLLELSLGSDAYLTSTSTVSLKNAATNAVITAPYTVNTTDNKILFTEKGTAMCATGNFIVTITNVKIPGTSSGVGSRTISVTAKDYALRSPENSFSTLSFGFDNDSNTYGAVWVDNSNSSPANVTTFTVKGSPYDDVPDGYANGSGDIVTLAKTTLVLPTFGESGLKKIKLTGAKANYGGLGGTRVYLGTVTSGASATTLGYITEDGGNTIVLTYPLTGTTPTLTITNLELTSLTQGSNTLSAKYEYLAGWESSAKTTTVIYDNVAPVVGSSTLQMGWVVRGTETEIPGVSSASEIDNQYLMIPVTETNSGVRKIKIEVEKDGTSTTTASCDSLEFFGYSDTSSSDSYGGGTDQAIANTASGNEITISDPVTHGKHKYYYIRGIKISDSTTMEEGNYTLHVTLYDYAGNVSDEKTIDMCNDHTKPVVKDTWFEGVENTALNGSGTYKHPHHRTYTNSSTGNILYVKLAENGSGIKNINLDHYTGYDPYSGAGGCRTVIPTASTKLYKSTDNGTTYTEVTGISYSATSSDRSITIPQTQAISGSGDILLKITELKITEGNATTDDECRNEIAAALRVDLTDFATNVNEAPLNPASATVGTNNPFAAVVEDSSSPGFKTDCGAMRDSGKRISDSGTLVADENSIEAYNGYTNTSVVNIECAISEFAWNSDVTSPSGLRVIKLEGASFIPDTEQDGSSGSYITWSEYVSTDGHANFNNISSGQQSQYYLSSEDSIENCGFGYAEVDLGFYLVGDDTLVFKTPMNVRDANWFYINNIKLNSTTSDGSKNVTVKLFDTANQYSTSCASVGTATFSIVYCGTAPTITVNDTAKSDPATITAANIQTLVPKNNGLQAYAEGTTVWTFSHSSQNNRKGSNSTPSGNGVYLGRSYCPYFDLDITPSTAANLLYYKWTNSETVPTSWNTTNSSYKVDVNFPTSGDVSANSVTAMDWYLHVADYAGNVTTKKMSTCQWINETVASAWPKRKDDTGKKMENGVYYLESDGFYATDIPRLTVTLPAGTTGAVKVYIPTSWFDKVCTNGAPIYGYAMGNHERYGEGHEDISKAKRDATGPYLEIPQSYITESTAQSTNYAEFYFYVYDAVGQDLTAVVKVTVDSTPPYFEVNLVPQGGTSSSNKHMKWSQKTSILTMSSSPTTLDPDNRICVKHSYNDSSAPIATFLVQGGTGDSNYLTTGMTSIGLSSSNPFVLYTDADSLALTFLTRTTADSAYPNEGDTLKIKYSINDATATEIDNSFTAWSYDPTYFYGENASISVTNTPQTIKFSAVDKGANSSDIYIKLVKDTEGPTISATDVQKVNQITENVSGSDVTTNYFGSYATADVVVTDALSGLYSVNGSTSSSDITAYSTTGKSTNLASMTWKDGDAVSPNIPYSLTLNATDVFGNSSSSSMDNDGCSRWVKDTDAPETPTLTYETVLGVVNALGNTLKSDYYSWGGKDGLKVTQSSSTSWTVKFDPDNVTKITVTPSATDNSGGSGIMGYVVSDSSTPATFYSKDDVSSEIDIPVTSITSSTSSTNKYIFAVDKAGNPSGSCFTLAISRLGEKPDFTIASRSGIYTSGNSGWFKEGASVSLSGVTNSPTDYILVWGSGNSNSLSGSYTSSTITIPNDAHGGTELSLVLYNGRQSTKKYIESGTTSKTVSSWTLDNTEPTDIAVSSVSATDTGGKAFKASNGTIYYNSSASNIVITPTSTENGSGIKGYATSNSFADATPGTVTVSTSGSPTSVTIYAFDNVGNSSSQTFTLSKDTTAPEVGYDESSMVGCKPIGSTLYFKDNNATLNITVTETGSGVASTSPLKNGDQIVLSKYTSGGKLTIPSKETAAPDQGYVIDNVGNSGSFDLITNIVQDNSKPTPPTGVYATSTGGNAYPHTSDLKVSANGTIYYSEYTTSLTLTLSGAGDTGGSLLAGYTASGVTVKSTTDTTLTIEPVSGTTFPASITIKSVDGVGNESDTGLTVNLTKDVGKPTVEAIYPTNVTGLYKNTTTGKIYFTGTTPTATLSINDNSGSGIPTTGSLQDGATISLSAYYAESSHSLVIPTNTIYDNVGNTQEYTLDLGNVYKDDAAPTDLGISSTITAAGTTGARYYYDSANATIYFNNATTSLTVTPSALDTGGSGIKGYALSNSFSDAAIGNLAISTSGINESGTSKKIYAFDNVGNSTYITLTLKKDETVPSVSTAGTYASGQTGLYTTSSRIYFNGDTAKATLATVSDGGSGLHDDSLTSSSELTLSTYYDAENHSLKIPIDEIKDNVGNTQVYTVDSGKVFKDETAPDAPTGVAFAANSGATVYNPADTNTLYYNGSTTSITLTLSGASDETGGSGLAGYTATGVTLTPVAGSETTKVTISTEGLSDTVTFTIKSKDNVGNVSETGLEITLTKDAAPPTAGTPTLSTGTTTKANIMEPGGTSVSYTVNVFSSGSKVTIPITEEGAGIKRYAFFTSTTESGTPSEWKDAVSENGYDATTQKLTLDIPEFTTVNNNMILLLEDNLGNVTQKTASGEYANTYHDAVVKVGDAGWSLTENISTIAATYSISGNSMTVTISGARTAISKIEVTAANVTSGAAAKFKYIKTGMVETGDYTATGAATVSGGKATYTPVSCTTNRVISYDGSITFTLSGGSSPSAPTSIKLNGTIEIPAASIVSANTFSGFIRHSLPAIESLVDNSGRSGVIRRSYGAERAVDLATYFNALSSAPEEKAEDTKIAFNIGRNMENGGIAEKTEKVVTTAENVGYMDEASIAEELPVQNHAWRAPDGFVSEETEAAGNQLLAQNAVVEFSSPNKVLTATDAALEDESGKNYEKWLALALSLLSVCALGLVVTLGRGRMKKNS